MLRIYKNHQIRNQTESVFKSILDPFQRLPGGKTEVIVKEAQLPPLLENIYQYLYGKYKQADSSQLVVWGLISVNAIIFAGWQLPFAANFMNRHFVYVPSSNRAYTLFTSCFSHQGFAHFAFNMMALNSLYTFYQQANRISGEQTLAFYLNAGVISALGAHLIKSYTGERMIGSLGASGAIC
jgi:membrane associated rhomboid family serine protease